MSVATKSYVSSYGNNQHTDEMAQRPRSPNTNYVPQSQRPSALYTSQESSLKRPSSSEGEEHRDKRHKGDQGVEASDIDSSFAQDRHIGSTQTDSRTHVTDSQSTQGVVSNGSGMVKPEPEFEAFLLCRSAVPRSRPDPSQHLLSTYGLGPLLRTVARVDPISGEKINKLRKSYEGQIKTFQLSGRNKPLKAEKEDKDDPGPLRRMGIIPEDRWKAEQGSSEIEISDRFREKLKLALQIQPGRVRNNAQWEDVLGLEKPRPGVNAGMTPASRPSIGPSRPLPATVGDKRSTRGKKRSYGDESYVGYGEGYSDGDDAPEDDDDYARRKRKKELNGQINR